MKNKEWSLFRLHPSSFSLSFSLIPCYFALSLFVRQSAHVPWATLQNGDTAGQTVQDKIRACRQGRLRYQRSGMMDWHRV